MPAQKTVTLRYTQTVSSNLATNAQAFTNINEMLIPGLNTVLSQDADFAGGWLTHFRFYDKCQVLSANYKATVLNAGLVDDNNIFVPGTYGQGYVVAAVTTWESSQNIITLDGVDGAMKHLRTLPGSDFKILGGSSGGHDIVTVHTSCDLQKFIGQQPDNIMSCRRRDATTIILPSVATIPALQQTPVFVLFWGNQYQSARPNPSTLKIVFEIEIEYTCQFTSLRTLDRTLADSNRVINLING